MDAAEQLAKMLKRQPSNNTNKSENSESPTRNGSFEVLINLKILADETGKQMWAENCLMEHKGTIRELVVEAKEKFVPNDFKKGTTLKLRNVTTYSTRYNLEVSVDIDGKAMDGGKYIANFIVDLESQEQAESSSMKSAKENDKSAKTITAEFLEKQTRLEELDNDLIAIRTQLDEANKVNKTMQIECDNNEKLLKSQQNELKKSQNQLDEIKKEIEAKKTEKKTLNERIDKKNKELDSIRKHLKEKDKKLESCKKDLANGVEELDKMIKKKENALKECEELQSQKEEYARSLEDLRNDELLCRNRIDEMQQEEKQFQIMLKEMREQTLLQRIAEAEQREQQEREQFTIVNDPVETTSANNSTPRKEHPKAFTQRCMYYERGSCWRGDKCTFIHEESRHRRMRRPTPQQHDEFYYGRQQREEQTADGIEPVIKREERRSEKEIGTGIGGRVGTAVPQEGGMPPKKMPIQIENIEGLILANEQQQLNQRLAQGLGQEIVVDHENVEILENDNAENAGNWLMVNEDAFSQAPFQQQMQQRNWNAQQELISIRTNQFFNNQPPNYNDISEQQYTINNNNNMNNNNRGRTVYRNDLYGAHKFQQQKQGQKRGGSKMRADKNAGKRGRYRPRSRSNGNTSRHLSTSPIRNTGHMPSTSSAPYGNHQTIMDRITIDEPPARGPPNSHSIHARLTFEQ